MTDVWDKEYKGKSSKLTPEQKKKAENRARKAGRSYPNMIDNMWAANESVDPSNREAVPRNDKRDRKQIDLVVRAVKTARKDNKKMYRQQSIQKQVLDTTGGNNTEYDTVEEDMYIPPASQSLNIARGHMPQIKSADYDDFIKFLRAKGHRVTKKKIEPKNYKATQKNFNQDKVAGLMGKNLDKEIFVSKDKYVVDGHHRWLAAWNDGVKLNAYVFHVPIRELIELMREYPKSFKKNINESEPELEKIVSSDRDDRKYMVRVKNEKGNIVTVHFGDPNMRIKTSDPEARKNFRARHNCDNPGPKTSARYWSCKLWSTDSVEDHK